MASNPPNKKKCECNFTCLPKESGAVAIQARQGEAKGHVSAAGAHGARVKLPAALLLLGDLMTATLACVTVRDKPSGCKHAIAGSGSVWGFGGHTGHSPCASSAWQPLHNARPPICATCSSSRVDSGAFDRVQPEKQLPLRATDGQINNAGVSSDLTVHLLAG